MNIFKKIISLFNNRVDDDDDIFLNRDVYRANTNIVYRVKTISSPINGQKKYYLYLNGVKSGYAYRNEIELCDINKEDLNYFLKLAEDELKIIKNKIEIVNKFGYCYDDDDDDILDIYETVKLCENVSTKKKLKLIKKLIDKK